MHDLIIRNGTIVDGSGKPRFVGDVAIDGARITAVGRVEGPGRREIDATGKLVTPGWVDIHTHYDGQVTWDPLLSPSSWHGVTTVVMGNCGVGFAPVKPDFHDQLIGIMEGVEDIPGTALSEGMTWGWETFPEYMDLLATRAFAMDVGAQVPHAALRTYVMGIPGEENAPATPADIDAMAALVRESMDAGALGFTTSRITAHRTARGDVVPGTGVSVAEMDGIARALAEAGHGIFECVTDLNFDGIPGSLTADEDIAWMGELSRRHGVRFTYLLHQNPGNPDKWRHVLEQTRAENAKGADLRPQISIRPIGVMMGWQSSFHVFMGRPSHDALAALPLDARLARLRDPAVRQAILSEQSAMLPFVGTRLRTEFMFPLARADGTLNYEPGYADSVKAEAERSGRSEDEVLYDLMMANDGHGLVFVVIMNYGDYNLDFVRELIQDPQVVIGGSDAGAHCAAICDAALPTFMLSHWARDRERGAIPIEEAVANQTSRTARCYNLFDRGLLAPGMKADVNIIDFAAVGTGRPVMNYDLPAGGKRLLQSAQGYVATIVSGIVTQENGAPTGALPGRLLRGGRNAFQPADA